MSFDLILALIQNGANLDSKNDCYGLSPLHRAVEVGDHKLVSALLEAGADIEVQDTKYYATPLSMACRLGQSRSARMLVERGATVTPRTGIVELR